MTSSGSGLDILRAFAPGTPLRNAIELILRQETGALIVLNGKTTHPDAEVTDGDEVAFFPPVTGG